MAAEQGGRLRRGIATVLLLAVYVAVIGPLALIHRLLRRDPLELRRREKGGSLWHERPPADETLEGARAQYLSWRR